MKTLFLTFIFSLAFHSFAAAQHPEIQGWNSATWGMSESEVLASVPGARRITRAGVNGTALNYIGIDTLNIGGYPYGVYFTFNPVYGLQRVGLVHIGPASTEEFPNTSQILTAKYGAPSSTETNHWIWSLEKTRIELTQSDNRNVLEVGYFSTGISPSLSGVSLPENKSVAFIGGGFGGAGGFAGDIGVMYMGIGIGVSANFAQALSKPGTTDPYPSEFISSSTSTSEKYDNGYISYDLLGAYSFSNAVSIFTSIGYYTHKWVVQTTTKDNDHILSDATTQTDEGTYSSGLSYGGGINFNVSREIMLGVRYVSINAFIAHLGFRF